MSTATEISRLTDARNTIRDKLIELGLATSTAKLDTLATAVDGINNRGAVSATVQEGDTYTIPAGYHNGSGTVSGVAGGGNYSLQSKTATPTKNQQSITPDSGYYGLSDVTVAPIPEAYQNVSAVNAAAGDVLSGKVIVDSTGASVTGTMPNNGAVSKTLDATSNNQTYTVPKGYHSGTGTVQIVLETKTAVPTTSSQDITPTSGKVLSKVTVSPIPSAYQDVSNVDAVAGDVLTGKTIVAANGAEVEGTMPNIGAVSKTLDVRSGNTTYTVPKGYHDGTGVVNIVTETKSATPALTSQTISPTNGKVLSGVTVNAIPSKYGDTTGDTAVAANLLSGITAHTISTGAAVKITGTMPNNGALGTTLDATTDNQSYVIPAGYTSGGTVSISLETKSATPTKASQDITPASGKVLSKVTVAAIPAAYQDVTNVDAVAGDVLAGKTIVAADGTEVEGTMTNRGAVSKTLDASSGNQNYTVPAGYHNGSGTVKIVLETKSATPSTSSQSITPTSGKVLSKVTVNAIPAKFGDTTGDTAVAANILAGVKAHSISNGAAVLITGTMANNGTISGSIDGLTATSYSIPAGYTAGGTVSLTSDIEDALEAI